MDAASGLRFLVSDFGNAAQGPQGVNPFGLALEAAGTVLVIDQAAGTGGLGALFRVDAASGNRSVVSDFGNAAQGPQGVNPRGLALEAAGTILVIDPGAGALFRVDRLSGQRGLVSDFGNRAQGPQGASPLGLALEAAGTVLVIDVDAGTGTVGALVRVDRLSGLRETVSDFGNGVQGGLGVEPFGVAVVVPNCDGRVPTVVGDNGNNVLIGSPRADVIIGRSGADLVDGLGGNDRICGGGGNDALRGGSGNDRLDGGAGADVLIGGKGRDRCKRGEAKLSCER